MKCGIVVDDFFTFHQNPFEHPERPERIKVILKAITAWEGFPQLERIPPRRATAEWILAVHTEKHLQRIKETAGDPFHQLDPDTYTSADSFEVGLLAAGSAVSLAEGLVKKEINVGFAVVRPLGHHAQSQRAMGFCLFNNVAVASEWAIRWAKSGKLPSLILMFTMATALSRSFTHGPTSFTFPPINSPSILEPGILRKWGRQRVVVSRLTFPLLPAWATISIVPCAMSLSFLCFANSSPNGFWFLPVTTPIGTTPWAG